MNKADFNIIRTKLTKFIAIEGKKRLHSRIYGISNCACSEKIRREALLYAYLLDKYTMSKAGSIVGYYNYNTIEELNNVIVRVKRISQDL